MDKVYTDLTGMQMDKVYTKDGTIHFNQHSLLPGVTKVLAHMGDIIHITIVRKTLSKELTLGLNIMSLGEYTHFSPLFMVITTSEGRYVLEKNAVITVDMLKFYPEHFDQLDVELKRDKISLINMLDFTRKYMGDELFFGYDAVSNNCQTFIDSVLKSNLMSTSATEAFIIQDSSLYDVNIDAIAILKYHSFELEAARQVEQIKLQAKHKAEEIKLQARHKAEDIKLQARHRAGKMTSIKKKRTFFPIKKTNLRKYLSKCLRYLTCQNEQAVLVAKQPPGEI
jgi:hypothetical protein